MRSQWLPTLLATVLAGCSGGAPATSVSPTPVASGVVPTPASSAARTPSVAPTFPANVLDLPEAAALSAGAYFIEPDSIPVRVHFTVPTGSAGWVSWIGTFKPEAERPYSWVALSIANVTNVVTHGCTDHAAKSPPVGPTVEDLATALTELAPFERTGPPTDVVAFGYRGKHLELTVPDLPTRVLGDNLYFTECGADQELKSWIGAPLSYAFYGYTGPGQREELWILDVDGRRLVISAVTPPDAPSQDVSELRSILDSLTIEAAS